MDQPDTEQPDTEQPDIELVLATAEHLRAHQRSRSELGEVLGTDLPDGWPEFPEAIDFTLAQLEAQAQPSMWSMYFFVDRGTGRLVGSGGYAHAPRDRATEIGYEVAPAARGRGVATAAARALVLQAFDTGEVDVVVAHTLAEANPSTGVLRKLGFEQVAELPDPEVGHIWEWRLERPDVDRSAPR
jgi:RimJ/RimL family protein N-acetyltransferase